MDAPQPTGRFARTLTAFSDNTYLSAIRAGMVSVVPLTIIGGLFMIVPVIVMILAATTMTLGLLGPCRCQGCGGMVYWGRAPRVRDVCWRDIASGNRHYCAKGLRM